MDQIISRCGFRCDICPAFTGNNKTFADQARVAAGWSKYFGLKMPPEKIRCTGCLSQDYAECDLPDRACPIRPCVLQRGMNSCADCFDYPCKMLEARMKGVEEAISRFRDKTSQEEFGYWLSLLMGGSS